MKRIDFASAALMIVDVQMAFAHRDAAGAERSVPDAERNIARLLEAVRVAAGRVVHIHHHSHTPGSPFIAGLPGAEVQDFVKPSDGEAVYVKHVNSAFIGTGLEEDLRRQGVRQLVICGATANHCVETTTRMAGNLGFDTYLVCDAVWTYGQTGPDGHTHSPDDVLSMTLANMQDEFASVADTAAVLDAIEAARRRQTA